MPLLRARLGHESDIARRPAEAAQDTPGGCGHEGSSQATSQSQPAGRATRARNAVPDGLCLTHHEARRRTTRAKRSSSCAIVPLVPKATVDLDQLVRELATRSKYRTEADVQSRVRDLLLYGGLNVADDELDVQLEAQAGSGLRIDVEVGSTVIEVKKDLTKGGANTLADWERQVAGYLRRRTDERGQRYVGILTDGCVWWLYNLHPDGTISRVGEHVVRPAAPNIDALRTWLEAVLATVDAIKPTPREISRRLGVASPGHALDSASLTDLWKAAKAASPEARLKRELWAKLLRTAFGEHFTDDDELFVEHTYLVLAAEVVAHAVLNIPVEHLSAQAVLSGQEFSQRGVHGVVEADFFDWVLQVEGGERFVGDLGRRLSRFDWSAVEHDVLKHLYESVIDEQQRHRLGEYYTPDWLAEKIVADVVDDPLNQRTLDPACGSGTFVFHAVRRFLDAADAAGKTNRDAIRLATSQVLGVDVHPVAVTLARVTYLLALGTKRLDDERDAFGVPIYLGDTMQWDVALGTLGDEGGLNIPTEPAGVLFGAEVLSFPEVVLDPPGAFDSLVLALADRATTDRVPGSKPPRIKGLLDAHKVPEGARATIVETFAHLCSLHDNNRDHIWAYYARNLARPLWLARPGGRVDRLVGNPPWLSYRFMTPRIQQLFRERSTEHGLWAGSAVAPSGPVRVLRRPLGRPLPQARGQVRLRHASRGLEQAGFYGLPQRLVGAGESGVHRFLGSRQGSPSPVSGAEQRGPWWRTAGRRTSSSVAAGRSLGRTAAQGSRPSFMGKRRTGPRPHVRVGRRTRHWYERDLCKPLSPAVHPRSDRRPAGAARRQRGPPGRQLGPANRRTSGRLLPNDAREAAVEVVAGPRADVDRSQLRPTAVLGIVCRTISSAPTRPRGHSPQRRNSHGRRRLEARRVPAACQLVA